jgi:hypothetical protein
VSAATAVSSLRTTDRINAQLVSPGSSDLPFVVAARQVARIASIANNNPPVDYGKQRATGLVPGLDGVQWDYPTRDAAVKAGSSTVEISDGVVNIADVVTFYAPVGEVPPAYRYVCDIVKLQNIIYNIALIFSAQAWAGAPLIPDSQATVNPAARRPKDAKAAAAAMVDSLGAQAIISDPASTKKAMTAVINAGNPKRLDLAIPVWLSGNTNIISVGLNFSFYYGGTAGGVTRSTTSLVFDARDASARTSPWPVWAARSKASRSTGGSSPLRLTRTARENSEASPLKNRQMETARRAR